MTTVKKTLVDTQGLWEHLQTAERCSIEPYFLHQNSLTPGASLKQVLFCKGFLQRLKFQISSDYLLKIDLYIQNIN